MILPVLPSPIYIQEFLLNMWDVFVSSLNFFLPLRPFFHISEMSVPLLNTSLCSRTTNVKGNC